MRVAIVGTSHINTDQEKRDVKRLCSTILSKYEPKDTTIITGGAIGVDSIAQEVALILRFKTKVYRPEIQFWEDDKGKTGFKTRNLKIANDCDELYCITMRIHDKKCYHHDQPQEHRKTAGCWVLKHAKLLNKKVKLIVMGKACQLLVTKENLK